eukprot:9698229-Lingulodinium_polyedra.AAC.1
MSWRAASRLPSSDRAKALRYLAYVFEELSARALEASCVLGVRPALKPHVRESTVGVERGVD